MKKKVWGGIAAILVIGAIASAGSQKNTPTQLNVTPTAASTTSPTTDVTEPAETTPVDTEPQTEASTPVTTQPTAEAPSAATSSCNPNYSPCIPNSASDLDCPDVGMRVTVIGTDVYRLDGDHDGVGCESY